MTHNNTYDLKLAEHGYSVLNELFKQQNETVEQIDTAVKWFGISPLKSEAKSWYQGYLGEVLVGEKLNTLKSLGFIVLHAVPIGKQGSDIDHIVITPKGHIYVINTKHHAGKNIWVSKNRISVDGQKTDYVRNSQYEAKRIAKRLNRSEESVTAVLTFVNSKAITKTKDVAENNILITTDFNIIKTIMKEEVARETILPVLEEAIYSNPATWAESWEDEVVLQGDRKEWFKVLKKTQNTANTMKAVWGLTVVAGIIFFSTTILPTVF